MSAVLPRYPVFIPSRGRADACLTGRILNEDGVPFTLAVAPREVRAYEMQFGSGRVVALPGDDLDIVAARNWIRDRSAAAGDARHWQLDDDLRAFYRRYEARRMYCQAGVALRVAEDLADRYENVALAGLVYTMFVREGQAFPPFVTNCHVYSCTLVLNSIPYRWRGPYNDDTDMCLQVLSGGWCTILVNAFCCSTPQTMKMKGGMTDSNANSYAGDGRLRMARTLERRWPGVVTTGRRWQRPQHVVNWRKFDTPLRLRPGIDLDALAAAGPDEYGMDLAEIKTVRSERLRQTKRAWDEKRADA